MASGSTTAGEAARAPPPRWPLFRSFGGYRPAYIGPDLVAGVTLAAIAIPAQMATARLGGLAPQVGFFAFIAATVAFFLFGSSRQVSVGADSTIAPIFAGALAMLAAGLALMVGVLVTGAGVLKMGWVGTLLSIPVTTGFLAGIAAHIVVSQLPAALGIAVKSSAVLGRLIELAGQAAHTNPASIAISGGVLALIAGAHRLSARIPGPLIAVTLATLAAAMLHLDAHGVALLGPVPGGLPRLSPPALGPGDYARLIPLALLVSLLVMVQTSATARSVPSADGAPDINADFTGLGAGNLLAGLLGAFPVNASPPVTDIVYESGGRSQLAGLTAVAVMLALLAFGTGLLRLIPQAALAGVLVFVAFRIVEVKQIKAVLAASRLEALLILATAGAIVVLPIDTGVGVGVALSLLYGLWSGARMRVLPMHRIPGATVWWPTTPGSPPGETVPGVAVLSFQAPLTFLNAETFARQLQDAIAPGKSEVKLAVLEAAGILNVDFTAAQAFRRVIQACQDAGVTFVVARLESVAAQSAFARLGLTALIGEDHIFPSVWEALAKTGAA